MWKKFAYYLNPATLFKSNSKHNKLNTSLKWMNGINRLSIIIFIFALIVIFYRLFG
jgi:hypothetical protein